jgi:hypothetical protein
MADQPLDEWLADQPDDYTTDELTNAAPPVKRYYTFDELMQPWNQDLRSAWAHSAAGAPVFLAVPIDRVTLTVGSASSCPVFVAHHLSASR